MTPRTRLTEAVRLELHLYPNSKLRLEGRRKGPSVRNERGPRLRIQGRRRPIIHRSHTLPTPLPFEQQPTERLTDLDLVEIEKARPPAPRRFIRTRDPSRRVSPVVAL